MRPLPKIVPIRPDAELEARVRRALYETEHVEGDEHAPSGAVAAFVVMAAFVAGGLLLAWVLR